MKNEWVNELLKAEAKALATVGEDGLPHVVPVSTVRVDGEKIILINYFFNQTLKNLLARPEVALSFWTGFKGYQVKGEVTYEVGGERFELTKTWVGQILPEREVKGIVVVTPKRIFDISARAGAGKEVF